MTIGHQLGLRLFIEGIEVPVIGASITIAPGAPATAAIQIIPTDKSLELYPRTVVHLFFYDFVAASAYTYGTVTGGMSEEDFFNQYYKLLFMGELHGIQFAKGAGNRSITLQCVDFSTYWDTTYQYNFNGELIGGRARANFIGANTNLFNSPLGHGVGTVAALLCSKCVSFEHLEGLLAGIVRILEAIGGVYYGTKTFKGCNDFASIAELRVKLLQQICAAEKDSSTKNLFARKAFNMWMNREVGSLGQLVTFRSLMHVLLKFIMHECYPNPAAMYVNEVPGLKKNKAYLMSLAKDPRTANLYKNALAMLKVANSAKAKIDDMLTTSNRQDLKASLEKDLNQLKKYDRALSLDKALNVLPGINTYVNRAGAGLSGTLKILYSGSSFALERAVRNPDNRQAGLQMLETITALQTLLKQNTKHSKRITYGKPPRVNNQIFRPDIWFAPPPMCNILFPELYSQFQWSRNYLREVSRLQLQTTNEVLGGDALFNGRYFAPNIEDVRKNAKFSTRAYAKTILPHELFTGIIPMFEKLSEANLFAMSSKAVVVKGAKIPYAQRVVNYQYFKHRFSSRQMAAMGRFNPWMVAGFPAALIDNPMTADDLALSGLPVEEALKYKDVLYLDDRKPTRAELLRELVPTQYLGMCVQLTHQVNQEGGVTQYAFTEARLHRESSEFLGADKAVVSRVVGSAHRTGVYAIPGMQVPKEKGRGPRGGRITKIVNVTRQYRGRALPTLSGKPKQAIVGDQVDVSEKTIEARATTGATSISQLDQYKAYQITESYTKRRRETVDLPIEEVVRPPWIWDGWHNLKIGETYMQFFGTNAIVDVEKFTAKDIIDQIAGADTYFAELEAKEGVSQGSKKAESGESLDAMLDRIEGKTKGSKKKTKKGTKNKTISAPKADPEAGPSVGMQLSADKKAQGLALITLEKERTVEAAMDYLVRLYSLIKSQGLDVETFLRNYCWRPIATMIDILGTSDLVLEEKPVGSGIVVATRGAEGFHSRSFSDDSNLFGLVSPQVTSVLGLTRANKAVAAKLDIRGLRRMQVRDYIQELTNSRGLLG